MDILCKWLSFALQIDCIIWLCPFIIIVWIGSITKKVGAATPQVSDDTAHWEDVFLKSGTEMAGSLIVAWYDSSAAYFRFCSIYKGEFPGRFWPH